MNDRNRWIALVVLCTGMLMIVLDMTIVNVALPSIQADLGFSQAGLAWVVNAYLIAFAGLLLLAGRLGDLAGRRDVFLTGLAVFTVASLACGLAVNQGMLIAARFAQGTGGAMTSAVILGMIVTMFPGPREQARAIGVFAFVASAGAAVGLLAGGILTQVLNWHWIFFVNLPIGAITAACAVRIIGRDRGAGLRAGMDVPGALLITAAMMLAVFTIVDPAAQQGWLAPKTLALAAASLVLLGAFIARQRTARHPLMPLRIFASRNVTGANLVQVLGTAGMFGMFFLGSLYLRQVQGYGLLDRVRPGHRGHRGRRRAAAPATRRRGRAAAGSGARPGHPGRLTARRAPQGRARHVVNVAACTQERARRHIHAFGSWAERRVSGSAGAGLRVLAGAGEVLGVDVGSGQPRVHLGAAAAHPDGVSGAEGEHDGD